MAQKSFLRIDRFNEYTNILGNSVSGTVSNWYICPWVDSFGKVLLCTILVLGTVNRQLMVLAGCTIMMQIKKKIEKICQQSQQIATSNKRVYRRPVFFGDDYQADASESVTKIGGIRTFVVGPSLVANTDGLTYSGGVVNMTADITKPSLAQYTPHPQYSAGKDIGQVTNSLHLFFKKLSLKIII